MPANKNALIRYKTIDNCLRNRYRRWTLDDLVEACSDALYDMEGITKGVCARTVQMDIQIMRSDKLGYNAPIEVYDRIYYRYADPDYSITEMPLSIEDCKLIKKAIILLENKKDKNNEDTIQVLNKVQDRLKSILNFGSPDKPRGLSIQPCKSEKEEPYIRHSSQGRSECLYLRIE